jgi:hypothetical protein
MVSVLRARGLRMIIFSDDHQRGDVHVFGDGHAKIDLGGAGGAWACGVGIIADAEISPENAAAILGISCAPVRRRMRDGLLPFRRVAERARLLLAVVHQKQY